MEFPRTGIRDSTVDAGAESNRGVAASDRFGWCAMALLLLVAMLLRLYRIGDDSLWYDEILSYWRATSELQRGSVTPTT